MIGKRILHDARVHAVAVVVLLGCLAAVYSLTSRPSTPDYPFGCDPFGYARQQQLFRTDGLVDGLDTRVKAPEAGFLIETAKQAGLTPKQFGEMIAPHCHHYEAGTDSVILQYPPGTGFLLSLLPAEREVQALHVLSLFLLVGVFGVFAVVGLPMMWTSGLVIAGLVPIAMALSNSALMVSASMPPTIGFVALFTAVLLWATRVPDRPSWWGGALIGLAAGVLIDIRVASVFIVLGMAAYIVVAMGTLSPGGLARRLPFVLAGLAAFAVAVLPHLAANAINAGSPLVSTYGDADSAGPNLSTALIARNLHYYFLETPAWPIAWAAVAAILAATAMALWGPAHSRRRSAAAAIGGALSFGVSVAFFATHQIAASPYLIPTAAFCVSICVFALAQSAAASTPDRFTLRAAGVVTAFTAALAIGQTVQLERHSYSVDAPAALLAPEAVVWADMTSGTIYFYTGKYAAKVIFTGECEQNRLIQAVADTGRQQFIVVDSDSMQRLVDRLGASTRLEEAGTLRAREERAIYRLPPDASLPSC
ncbi:hypothetical protein [Amorphus orientalis]|uniref:Uncharacterized protein n=1 Tax=Amorphus orientalis TaxID=649198 RepID=A0AAE3VQ98_9HYPH|nr:hypothetical protein [Amorphus orientalis]MDQ0316309.1 hypothetical protein [Amorphus orientalis]